MPLRTSDRLLVAASGSNVVQVYGVNTSTGALTLQTTLSITSPDKVVAHPSSGAFFVYKNSTSIECYQYNFRAGTGPTLGSSTPLAGLGEWAVTGGGEFLVYAKSTSPSSVFWRPISGCALGSESSVVLSGLTAMTTLVQPSDGSFLVVVDTSGAGVWKLAVGPTGLTVAGSKVLTVNFDFGAVTPDGGYFVYVGATGIEALNLSTFTTAGAAFGFSIHRFMAVSNTTVVALRSGLSHMGVTIGSGGTPVLGTTVDNGTTDFLGGIAYPPSRAFFYTGNNGDGEVVLHRVTGTSPYVTVTSTGIGVSPDALAYLSGAAPL